MERNVKVRDYRNKLQWKYGNEMLACYVKEDDLGKMLTQLCCEMERNVKRELFMLESDGRLCYEDIS